MRRRVPALITLAIVAVACGDMGDTGGESPDAPTAPTPAATSPDAMGSPSPTEGPAVQIEGQVNDRGGTDLSGQGAPSVSIGAGDFFFEPTFVETDPAVTVTATVTNVGNVPHTFTIDALGIDENLQAGDEVAVQIELPEEGPVVFYCQFHRAQGMQGAFAFGDDVAPGAGEGVTPTASPTAGGIGY